MKTNTEVVEEFKMFGIHAYISPANDETEIMPIEDFFHGRVENENGDTVILKDWFLKQLQAKDTQAEEMIKEILNGEPYIYHADIETIAQKYGVDLNSDKKV